MPEHSVSDDVAAHPPTDIPPGTCDWGDCEIVSQFWRLSSESNTWLPVCFKHSEQGERVMEIRARNVNRVEGMRPVRVGDEVHLNDYSNGEPDELNPAEVRGVVTHKHTTKRFGTVITVNDQEHYLSDYGSLKIVAVPAKDDIDYLLATIAAQSEEIAAWHKSGEQASSPWGPPTAAEDATSIADAFEEFAENVRAELKATADAGIDLGDDYLYGMRTALSQVEERAAELRKPVADDQAH